MKALYEVYVKNSGFADNENHRFSTIMIECRRKRIDENIRMD